jgi:hypothetical protein
VTASNASAILEKQIIRNLDIARSKLPDYQGTVYRSLSGVPTLSHLYGGSTMNPKDPHDRFYCMPAFHNPPCNFCRHRFEGINGNKCEAFPNGLTSEAIGRIDDCRNDPEALKLPCNGIDDIHYEPRETE